MDLSGLTAQLRELARTKSSATEQTHFDGQLPEAPAADGMALATAGAAAGYRGAGAGHGRVWTSATRSDMEFEVGNISYDGELDTMRVGLEEQHDDVHLGVALSYTTGETEFGTFGGQVDFDQWGITPYAMRTWDNTGVWALAGLGVGDLDYTSGGAPTSSATSSTIFVAGLEHRVATGGGVDVALRAEGMVSGLEADASALYEKTTAWTRGARGELEVGMPRGKTSSWRPYVLAGWRWDEGAGLSDSTIEYGGGLEMHGTDLTLVAEVRDSGGDDLGRASYSLALGYDAGHDARGLTASLSSQYGTERGDPFAQAFGRDDATGRGVDAFGLRLGYGASAWTGLLVPYLEADLDSGNFAGARLGFAYTRGPASLKFRHGFRPSTGSTRNEHESSLIGEIRF